MNILDESIKLLEEAPNFFGPCWCKKSLNYTCPQCYWREDYEKLKKSLEFDMKGNIKNKKYE